jgi:hypothetical protein
MRNEHCFQGDFASRTVAFALRAEPCVTVSALRASIDYRKEERMNAELKELERQRREINERIGEIEHERNSKETAPYVGRFFRADNSYSCPETPEDYWQWYFHCTGNEGRFITGFTFQRDKYGNARTEKEASLIFESHSFTEITQEEWDEAWEAFLTDLAHDEAAGG